MARHTRLEQAARLPYLALAYVYYVAWMLDLFDQWTAKMVPPGPPLISFALDVVPALFLVTSLALLFSAKQRWAQIAYGMVALFSTCGLFHFGLNLAYAIFYERSGFDRLFGWC